MATVQRTAPAGASFYAASSVIALFIKQLNRLYSAMAMQGGMFSSFCVGFFTDCGKGNHRPCAIASLSGRTSVRDVASRYSIRLGDSRSALNFSLLSQGWSVTFSMCQDNAVLYLRFFLEYNLRLMSGLQKKISLYINMFLVLVTCVQIAICLKGY